MDPTRRPRRLIVIPPARAGRNAPAPAATLRRLQAAAAEKRPAAPRMTPSTLRLVTSSPADGAVLLDIGRRSIDDVRASAPDGATLAEEQWYRLERPARPWHKLSEHLKAPRIAAGRDQAWTVTVVVDDAARTRLAQALVTILLDEEKGTGLEAMTDRRGRVSFRLSRGTKRLDAIEVAPLHGGWPVRLSNVELLRGGLEIAVPALSLKTADARGLVYGKPAAGAGKGVSIGVVDTGIGPHDHLKLAGGRNTTAKEATRLLRDADGHGSHVAGVIAATASGWRRGEASAVSLHAYRVFEAGDPFASTFAIQAAIKQAAVDGCDLVNLSLGDSLADEAVRDAVEFAWARGCVCLAAAGNDGADEVDYPARYPKVIAVSTIGLENAWPAGAYLEWTLGEPRGKPIGHHVPFFAQFSNRGRKLALTAPGVAIVSTLFGNRWGVMSGTSMATPIATGVLARRLAGSAVLAMPRDARRSAAIVRLATAHAQDLGFPARMQGKGLAR